MRNLVDVYHVEVANAGDGFQITFHGKTTVGTAQKIRVKLGWWLWCFIVRETFKAWTSKRAAMLAEVKRTDEAFPPNQQ
jgi:hypothetical protein